MKYKLQIDINVPRPRLVELYDDAENWPHWQAGFMSSEPVSGEPRQVGSKTKIIQKLGGRITEILETIESKDLPDNITCIYEAKGAWNRVVNRFVDISDNQTRWEFETEFRCAGIVKFMSVLMPGMFRKASLKEMQSFKAFAENANT